MPRLLEHDDLRAGEQRRVAGVGDVVGGAVEHERRRRDLSAAAAEAEPDGRAGLREPGREARWPLAPVGEDLLDELGAPLERRGREGVLDEPPQQLVAVERRCLREEGERRRRRAVRADAARRRPDEDEPVDALRTARRCCSSTASATTAAAGAPRSACSSCASA